MPTRSSPSTPEAAGCSGRPTRSPTTSSSPCPRRRQGSAGRDRRPRAALRRQGRASCGTPGPTRAKSLEGYGRGLLAGDLIYWPTQNEIQVLDQRTGLQRRPPIKLQETYHTKGGNLAAGDGYLIVAQADGLVVFCQNSRLIERYREEIARTPERAANYFRLARAAEAIGRDRRSHWKCIEKAAQKARPNETIDGVLLAGVARDHLFQTAVAAWRRTAQRARRWDEAVAHLESAGVAPDRPRAAAGAAAARGHPARNRPARASCRDLPAALDRRAASTTGGLCRRRTSNGPRRSADRRSFELHPARTRARRV